MTPLITKIRCSVVSKLISLIPIFLFTWWLQLLYPSSSKSYDSIQLVNGSIPYSCQCFYVHKFHNTLFSYFSILVYIILTYCDSYFYTVWKLFEPAIKVDNWTIVTRLYVSPITSAYFIYFKRCSSLFNYRSLYCLILAQCNSFSRCLQLASSKTWF
jgi:hypothetical protein